MKFKRILTSAALTAALFSFAASPAAVYAYELPNAYWSINDRYEAAVNNKNYAETIEYASQIIDLIINEPTNDQTQNILGSRMYEAAFASYYLKNYDDALKFFSGYIPYGKSQGWDDGVKIAENFVMQLTPKLDVYKFTSDEQVYFGAKNEPHGILCGEVSETSRSEDSMVLLYLEYGNTYFDWANRVLSDADKKGKTVELALNFPNEGGDARSISSSDSYLKSFKELLSRHSDVPILLRIGAEMNIWKNACTPDEFKNAFITVASAVRSLPNVATVWSPASTSDWTRTASDFYPGDEYVDWVGVNAYLSKYFLGQRWPEQSVFNEVVFKSGYNADPVLMVKEIIDEYGGRKPVMISECGSDYYSGGDIDENYIDWSVEQLKNLYSLIPMVYPQVKLMAYFNARPPHELNYCDYNGCSELKDEYLSIKQSPWFIQRGSSGAETYFEKLNNSLNAGGTVTLGAYPRLYGSDRITVDYYIDDTLAASSAEAPYRVTLDIPDGSHTLKAAAYGNNGAVMEKTYSINGAGQDFSDTAYLSEVQREAVKKAVSLGIISGYGDNTFRPSNTISRAEFASIICRAAGYPTSGQCAFEDARDHWASAAIKACADAGAIAGIGNNLFAPESNITLEQAVKIVTSVTGTAPPNASYPDGYLSAAYDAGIMENLSSYEHSESLSRIDAAMLITQAID